MTSQPLDIAGVSRRRRWNHLKPPVVAKLLGCSTKTLERWRAAGKGPAWVRDGRRVRYEAAEVQRFMDGQG